MKKALAAASLAALYGSNFDAEEAGRLVPQEFDSVYPHTTGIYGRTAPTDKWEQYSRRRVSGRSYDKAQLTNIFSDLATKIEDLRHDSKAFEHGLENLFLEDRDGVQEPIVKDKTVKDEDGSLYRKSVRDLRNLYLELWGEPSSDKDHREVFSPWVHRLDFPHLMSGKDAYDFAHKMGEYHRVDLQNRNFGVVAQKDFSALGNPKYRELVPSRPRGQYAPEGADITEELESHYDFPEVFRDSVVHPTTFGFGGRRYKKSDKDDCAPKSKSRRRSRSRRGKRSRSRLSRRSRSRSRTNKRKPRR